VSAPNLKDVSLPSGSLLLLEFDSALAQIATPLSSFTVNHGSAGVRSLLYTSNSVIALGLDVTLEPKDKVFVSYNPPIDIELCLRGVLPSDATAVDKKRNSVKTFSRVPGRNLLLIDPDSDGSNENSNLGADAANIGYPNDDRTSDPRSATVDDFILAYGEKEAIQLTNLEDGSATSVNAAKLRMAIEDANALIDNYILQANRSGRVLISSNRRRTALIIARFYLDTVRRREDVLGDYERAIKELEVTKDGQARVGTPALETRRGAIRIHRIPQRYNSVTGKGLSGWGTDPDTDNVDQRKFWDAYNQNLSDRLAANTSLGEPTEGGGIEEE
jgi:phage gp36-like protein